MEGAGAGFNRPLPPAIAPRLIPASEPLDGTTVWSDEVGLDGPTRLLAWAVVRDDADVSSIHYLFDTRDIEVAMRSALWHANQRGLLGRWDEGLTAGLVAATLNDIANASVRTYTSPSGEPELGGNATWN